MLTLTSVRVCVGVYLRVYWLMSSRAVAWLKHIHNIKLSCVLESQGHFMHHTCSPSSSHWHAFKEENGHICFPGLQRACAESCIFVYACLCTCMCVCVCFWQEKRQRHGCTTGLKTWQRWHEVHPSPLNSLHLGPFTEARIIVSSTEAQDLI